MLGNAAISVRPGTGFARFGDVAERAAEVGRWKASSEDRSFQTIGRCPDGILFYALLDRAVSGQLREASSNQLRIWPQTTW